MTDSAQALRDMKREHEFLVGVDSDGCVFDTMEIKHKECFIPNIIKHWGLQPVSKYAREAAEFVNLYSKWRGVNRFPALTMVFDLLSERGDVKRRHVEMPEVPSLRAWIERESKLGNPALKAAAEESGDQTLWKALEWSEDINKTVGEMVHDVPPFPFVKESLDKLSERADIVVVSSTPTEALKREWVEHGIDRYVRVIAGQEMGKKKEHLQMAASGKYSPENILMIGDAPGDMKAARSNNALFYPVIPAQEERSWERFLNEAMERFFNGTYAGDYEESIVRQFLEGLPETPPWKSR